MKKINVVVGDQIEKLGRQDISRENCTYLRAGCAGTVVEVHPPRRGEGMIVDSDGEEIPDPDQDGYAVVEWPTWGRRLILVKGEGKDWRKT